MNFDVEFTTHVPIYIQLSEQVKHAIASGELKPGDQLPTVRQLAADLRVNFNTIARAYRALEQTGYARIDLRLDAEGTIWMIESNPNPQLSLDEELALSAKHAGVSYGRLISRILSLGMRRSMGEE